MILARSDQTQIRSVNLVTEAGSVDNFDDTFRGFYDFVGAYPFTVGILGYLSDGTIEMDHVAIFEKASAMQTLVLAF